MSVFDPFHSHEEEEKKKAPMQQVSYTGDSPYFDYQEGFVVSDNEDDLQRRLGNRQIQYVDIRSFMLFSKAVLS